MKNVFILLLLLLNLKHYGQDRFAPDTTLNKKIRLLNSISIIKNLGDQTKNKFEDEGLPRVTFINKKRKTYVILYGQPGANSNKFAYFEVGKVLFLKNNTGAIYSHLFDAVRTESGIYLGMTSSELKAIKGKPNSQEINNSSVTYKYKLTEKVASNFLSRYNMPVYSANYTFVNNRLVKFSFGFDYP